MSEWAGVAAQAWWRWTASMSIQLALLVLVVALADRCLARRTWPQLGAMLWWVVFFKLLIPPTFSSPISISRLGPSWSFPMGHEAAVTGLAPGTAPIWVVALFVLWLGGLALFATLALRRYLSLRRWLNGASVPTDAALRARSRRLAARLGLARPPRVRVLLDARTPALVGFFRPLVVLPPELVRAAGPRLEHVLLHEFAHLKRRDASSSFVCLVLQLLYWFHPLVWLARRRLATWREIACDRTVASVLDGPTRYRRTLLDLSRPLLERPTCGRLGFAHAQSQLLTRLEWLERPLTRSRVLQRAVTSLVFALLLLCCVPLARPPQHTAVVQLPALDQLEGCMQVRFAVLARLARENRGTNSALD